MSNVLPFHRSLVRDLRIRVRICKTDRALAEATGFLPPGHEGVESTELAPTHSQPRQPEPS